MAYEARHLSRFKVRYESDNDDNPITWQLVRNGVKVTPTSATIAIYKPGSTTAVLAATTMGSPSGTLFSYSIDASDTDDFPAGTGFRAHIVTTVSTTTYDDDVYFDVAKNVPVGYVTRDSLIALDDRLLAMDHAGDEDFSEIIRATWDEIQFDLETRSAEGGQLLDSMIVDRGRLSVAARFLIMSRILRPKGHTEDAAYYEERYKEKLRQFLAGIPMDVNEDQEEDSDQTVANIVRLVY